MLRNTFHTAIAVFTLLSSRASLADQPLLLNLDSGSGGSLLAAAASTGTQVFNLDAIQRGVTASGATRVASPFGWSLNADPSAFDEVGLRMFGPIDLATGAVTYADTQLVLPAVAPWPIGISYNSGRTASTGAGGGMQGNYWFQASQPSITLPDAKGVIRLFYAANAFVEFKQIGATQRRELLGLHR
jgi:hypothetical protein